MKSAGIYKIVNIITNDIYIGSAVNFRSRFKRHINALRQKRHCNDILQNAWNKYGEENFKFEVVEKVLDKSKLFLCEQQYLDLLHPKYNIREKADNRAGFLHKNETREKISKSLKGRVGINKGKKFSDQWKKNISEALSKRFKNKMNHPWFGKQKDEDHRKKISDSLIGRESAFKGKRHSDETKRKMRLAWKKRKQNENNR